MTFVTHASAMLIALVGLATARAGAQEIDPLQTMEQQIEVGADRAQALSAEATALGQEIQRLRTELVTTAAEIQQREATLSGLEKELARLDTAAAAKEADLAHRHAQLAATLATLQRLSLQPAEALILASAQPLDAARRTLLLRALVPTIASRADALRHEIDALQRLRHDIARKQTGIAALTVQLRARGSEVAALVAEKKTLQKATSAEQKTEAERVAALAQQAENLRDLVAQLATRQLPPPPPTEADADAAVETGPEASPGADTQTQTAALPTAPAPLSLPPFPTAPGSLRPPVVGSVVDIFGKGEGAFSHGIVIEARPGAQVVAPFDGQVKFSGSFRGYGQLLIIEHSGAHYSLLAGLGRSDASAGQWVVAGEPVGAMSADQPRLYLELRQGDEPINPLPWLARQ